MLWNQANNDNNNLIIEQIRKVVETEGLISKKQLCKRVLAAWDISRLDATIDRRFEELFLTSRIKTINSGGHKILLGK